MADQNRQYKRIEKPISLHFCVADAYPIKWDMSVIKNISAGGVMFTAPSDMDLNNKTIQLRIKVPELSPHLLDIQAIVLEAKERPNNKYSDIRAKFINLTGTNKEHLAIVEKMVDLQGSKNVPKDIWKKN